MTVRLNPSLVIARFMSAVWSNSASKVQLCQSDDVGISIVHTRHFIRRQSAAASGHGSATQCCRQRAKRRLVMPNASAASANVSIRLSSITNNNSHHRSLVRLVAVAVHQNGPVIPVNIYQHQSYSMTSFTSATSPPRSR